MISVVLVHVVVVVVLVSIVAVVVDVVVVDVVVDVVVVVDAAAAFAAYSAFLCDLEKWCL